MSQAIIAERVVGRRQLVFRLASALGVIGLVAGVPIALLTAHAEPAVAELWVLFTHPALIQHVFAVRVSDGALAKVAWSIAWLAWAWCLACISFEIVGRVRGRTAKRIPGSRYVQSWLTYLVGASLAFGSPVRQAAPLRLEIVNASAPNHSPPQRYADRGQILEGIQPVGGPVHDATIEVAAVVTAQDTRERIYVVRPRDTLWSIAETQLGSPLDWPRIAAANYGRTQPDGAELIDDHWIRPGWLLVIPDGGTALPRTPPAPSIDSATDVEEAGMTPATIAGDPVPTTTTPGRIALPSGQIGAMNQIGSASATSPPPGTHRRASAPHLPVAPIGYGLMGAGIVALLDRMRRTQQRLRPTGLRIALPEGVLAELERGLRIAADPGSVDWVDLSLRLLSVTVQRSQLAIPAVSAVRLRDDAVEIVLEATGQPRLAPPPFEPSSDGSSWLLTKSGRRLHELQHDSEVVGIDAPLPSLVTLGRDDLGIVMVNVETAGSVAVSGAETDPLVEAIAVELATARWSDQIDVVLVGFGPDNEGLERVSHANSLRAVVAKMERRTRERGSPPRTR